MIKTVKAVKVIGPVDCDENYKVSYECVDCGYKWKQHMYAQPPQIAEGKFLCGNCWFGKDYEQKKDGYWSLSRKK